MDPDNIIKSYTIGIQRFFLTDEEIVDNSTGPHHIQSENLIHLHFSGEEVYKDDGVIDGSFKDRWEISKPSEEKLVFYIRRKGNWQWNKCTISREKNSISLAILDDVKPSIFKYVFPNELDAIHVVHQLGELFK
jgi:hypothetical protein